MSRYLMILSPLVLSLAAFGAACDKGPQGKEPTPSAQKTAEASAEGAEAKAAEGAKAEAPNAEGKSTADGKVYGEGVDESMESVAIADLVKDPTAYEGKTVRVEGMVTDVCAKRGCWFEMAGQNPGEKARFKVKDGVMVFPMSAKGKQAVAQGTIVTQKLTLEETRAREEHFAKESGREFDPESITEGQTVFQIQGTGAVITD